MNNKLYIVLVIILVVIIMALAIFLLFFGDSGDDNDSSVSETSVEDLEVEQREQASEDFLGFQLSFTENRATNFTREQERETVESPPANGESSSHTNISQTNQSFIHYEENSSDRKIDILSPKSKDVWEKGETQTIRWESSDNIDKVNIKIIISSMFLCNGNFVCATSLSRELSPLMVAEEVPNTGSFNWNVGNTLSTTLDPNRYIIQIEEVNGLTTGKSEIFTINGDIPFELPELTEQDKEDILAEGGTTLLNQVINAMNSQTQDILSGDLSIMMPYDPNLAPVAGVPAMNYNKQSNNPQPIMWMPTLSVFEVDIFLVNKNNGNEYKIAEKILNSGIFTWNVGLDTSGKNIPNGEYNLYIQDSSNKNTKSSNKPLNLTN